MNKEQLKKAFSDAIAWGFVYGPALNAQDFNELRDKKAEQLVDNILNKNVLVPKHMSSAMQEAVMDEDWTWGDLLVAAEAITEQEYYEIEGSS